MIELCAYCGRAEAIPDRSGAPMKFSQEHILPTSFANATINNPFTINCVHEFCNNVLGMFVDAPFIKNWLVQQEIVRHATDFINIEENPVLPLRYMGKVKGVLYEDKICDVWHGPTGDLIYHIHKPYPEVENLPTLVGVPPSVRSKEIDYGFAFLFIKSNNPIWHPTIIYSFINAFKKSILYSGNVNMPENNVFSNVPDELLELKSKLGNGKHEYELELPIYGEVRFMAKVALGFCAKLFGDEFIKSTDADLLRKFLWTVNPKEREEIPVHGTRFIHPDNTVPEFNQFYGWPGGHVITITNLPTDVCLSLSIYNSISSTIRMGSSKEYYENIVGDGICYIIVPGLKKVIGPIKQMDFLKHKFNMGKKIEELTGIEIEMEKYKVKPPFRV